jgi:hypothetical protein
VFGKQAQGWHGDGERRAFNPLPCRKMVSPYHSALPYSADKVNFG